MVVDLLGEELRLGERAIDRRRVIAAPLAPESGPIRTMKGTAVAAQANNFDRMLRGSTLIPLRLVVVWPENRPVSYRK